MEAAVQLPPDVTEKILKTNTFRIGAEANEILVGPIIYPVIENLFRVLVMPVETMKRFKDFVKDQARLANPMEALAGTYPSLNLLDEWWKNEPAHFQLTSVGIAISAARAGAARRPRGDARDRRAP